LTRGTISPGKGETQPAVVIMMAGRPFDLSVMMAVAFLVAFLVQQGSAVSVQAELSMAANPIRKVVTLMQKMQAKIEAEGEKEAELFKKFECYCKKTTGQLEAALKQAEEMGNIKPEDIEAKVAELTDAEQAVEKLKKDMAEDGETLKAAEGRHENEHAEHLKNEEEEKATEEAGEDALTALGGEEMDPDKPAQRESAPSFLQRNGVASASFLPRLLRALDRSEKVTPYAKQQVTAFLSGQNSEAAPASGEVIGYIKDMEDDAEAELEEEKKEDAGEEKTYQGLKKSKKQSIKSALASIGRKEKKIGELKVEIVNMKHMMADGAEATEENKKTLATVKKDCATRAAEEEERKTMRAQELVALADTIKMLNDDDALDLFKKTMPSPSLIQLSSSGDSSRTAAKKLLTSAKTSSTHRPELNFITLALSNKKVDFSKVFKKIDSMVALLKKEGEEDLEKKEYCEEEFDKAAEKTKELTTKIQDISDDIQAEKDGIEKLVDEMKIINDGIKALDESVTEATENRKAEAAEYQELMESDNAAVELLGMAKERLNKFYNPSFVQLSAAPEAAESGIKEVAVGTPPPTAGAYKKKGQESNGIIGLITTMAGDLEKEMVVAKTEEENSQEEYEETVAASKKKRAADVKAVEEKAKAKADLENDVNEDTQKQQDEKKKLLAAKEYKMDLHKECDWMMENFELRAKAREQETENLKMAKNVLAGADFSFFQLSARRLRKGN